MTSKHIRAVLFVMLIECIAARLAFGWAPVGFEMTPGLFALVAVAEGVFIGLALLSCASFIRWMRWSSLLTFLLSIAACWPSLLELLHPSAPDPHGYLIHPGLYPPLTLAARWAAFACNASPAVAIGLWSLKHFRVERVRSPPQLDEG